MSQTFQGLINQPWFPSTYWAFWTAVRFLSHKWIITTCCFCLFIIVMLGHPALTRSSTYPCIFHTFFSVLKLLLGALKLSCYISDTNSSIKHVSTLKTKHIINKKNFNINSNFKKYELCGILSKISYHFKRFQRNFLGSGTKAFRPVHMQSRSMVHGWPRKSLVTWHTSNIEAKSITYIYPTVS